MDVAAGVALLAGLASIVSPCVLPLIPTYVTYLGGVSVSTGTEAPFRPRRLPPLLGHAFLFTGGFALIFILFGLSATAVGIFLLRLHVLLDRLSGVIVFLFGLNLAGLLRIGWLSREWRWEPSRRVRPDTPWYSLLLGVSFSCGWTACVGPVLASILTLAANTASWVSGLELLAWYSLGLAVPFWVMALLMTRIRPWLTRIQRWLPLVQAASGVMLMILGVMLYLGIFARLSALFSVA
jgi:cytochrome c-type biogenesis protein